jgi:hypothetical protein
VTIGPARKLAQTRGLARGLPGPACRGVARGTSAKTEGQQHACRAASGGTGRGAYSIGESRKDRFGGADAFGRPTSHG